MPPVKNRLLGRSIWNSGRVGTGVVGWGTSLRLAGMEEVDHQFMDRLERCLSDEDMIRPECLSPGVDRKNQAIIFGRQA